MHPPVALSVQYQHHCDQYEERGAQITFAFARPVCDVKECVVLCVVLCVRAHASAHVCVCMHARACVCVR